VCNQQASAVYANARGESTFCPCLGVRTNAGLALVRPY
jgi:hypothetical protein